MKTKLAVALIGLLLVGCANIYHVREVKYDQQGNKTVFEKESARFLFEKEVAEKVGVATTDNGTNYSHTATAQGVQITGDVELIKAIGDAVANGIQAGAKGAVQGAK